MCVIIDINTFPSVFDPNCDDHNEFKPVLDWINNRKGRIVYGGSKYKSELRKALKYLGYLVQLKKTRQLIELNDFDVDQKQQELEGKNQHPDFDDAHIVAIVIVSGCRLVCSKDFRSYPFLKDGHLYPSKFGKVRIYSSSNNENLLLDWKIKSICKICKLRQ